MSTIKYETIFTPQQMAKIIDLWCNAKGPANKAILAYINTQPEVLRTCDDQGIFPPYLAYLLEYQLGCTPNASAVASFRVCQS